MQSIPDLDAIIAPDTVSVKEAAHYLSDTPEYQGKVWVTGLGLPSEMAEYVNSGVIEQFGLWNPEDLGYLASYAADALIKGTITGAEGDKFRRASSASTPSARAARSSSARCSSSTRTTSATSRSEYASDR